jgi:hypothetical protein
MKNGTSPEIEKTVVSLSEKTNMQTATSERLTDLITTATRLRELVDGEQPDRLLPGVLVARVCVEADRAASTLGGYLGNLQPVNPRGDLHP